MMRAVRVPLLVWYLVAGAALFAVDAARRAVTAEAPVIEISDAAVRGLAARHHARTGRAPGPAELDMLIARHARDEALARAARARGLAVGDEIIRRRLVQKLELLVAATTPPPRLDDEAIRAFHREHAADFARPARIRFEHVFFSPARADPAADAAAALARLGADADAVSGDAFVAGRILGPLTPRELSARFGDELATAVVTSELGQWHGPVRSRHGVHLIRVQERQARRDPPLAEVRAEVRRRATAEAHRQAVERALAELVAEQRVVYRGAPW